MRILVVEDDMMTALDLAEMLRDIGATVVGPVGRLKQAWALANRDQLDGAVLDVQLDGDTTLDLAMDLLRRGVPVVFATAFDKQSLPAQLAEVPRLAKPLDTEMVHWVTDRTFHHMKA